MYARGSGGTVVGAGLLCVHVHLHAGVETLESERPVWGRMEAGGWEMQTEACLLHSVAYELLHGAEDSLRANGSKGSNQGTFW